MAERCTLESEFARLAEKWRADTGLMSSVTEMAMHPAYQRIIGIGPRAVPLILRGLKRRLDHWFWALTAISGEDPVKPEDAGDIKRMAEAWLQWGEERGYLQQEHKEEKMAEICEFAGEPCGRSDIGVPMYQCRVGLLVCAGRVTDCVHKWRARAERAEDELAEARRLLRLVSNLVAGAMEHSCPSLRVRDVEAALHQPPDAPALGQEGEE